MSVKTYHVLLNLETDWERSSLYMMPRNVYFDMAFLLCLIFTPFLRVFFLLG